MFSPFLRQPHPYDTSLIRRLGRAFLVGLFITFFLGIFKPFELSELPEVWKLAIGYGAVTFLAMSLIDLVMTLVRIEAERWTLGKELAVSLLNVLFIGILNSLFSIWMGIAPWSWITLFSFTLYTLAIGIFPVSAIVLLKFQGQRSHFTKEAEAIDHELSRAAIEGAGPMDRLVLSGENQNERLVVPVNELLYLKASDNYVEAFTYGKATDRKVLRGSLRSFEDQLKEHDRFFRCHKSYIVNMDLVERVSGNAQGLRLHLKGGSAEVPVSRSLTARIRGMLTVHPGQVSRSPQPLPDPPKG